jgi:hypothetical protein
MKANILTRIMDEHVEMPGFPQIIVARGFCYQWLKARGWKESERGFGSLDYTAFARRAVDLPLTNPTERDYLLKQVENDYRR